MLKKAWKRSPVAFVLMGAFIALYLWDLLAPGTGPAVWGAIQSGFAAKGEWWRPLTAGFLHLSLAHLLGNLFGIWCTGRMLEQKLGSTLFLAVFLGAGLLAYATLPLLFATTADGGASPGIYALGGAAVALWFKDPLWAAPYRESGLFMGLVIYLVAANFVGLDPLRELIHLDLARVYVHLAGFAVGVCVGLGYHALAGRKKNGGQGA